MYSKSVWSSKIGDRLHFKKCVLMKYFCIFDIFFGKFSNICVGHEILYYIEIHSNCAKRIEISQLNDKILTCHKFCV